MRVTPEKREEKERVRMALVSAALRLAALHGFASLGLREVARAASIAPTSFYRHFADMEELGLSLIAERIGPLIDELAASVHGREPALAVLDALLARTDDDAELLRFLLSERGGASPAFRAALRAKLAVLTAALERAVNGADDDAERLPRAAADAAVVVLLDGCARALDDAGERAGIRRELAVALRRLLVREPRAGSTR